MDQPEIGLIVLSEPTIISVDLVFIHGLLGDRKKTWTAKGSSQSWPQALLPHDFPNARILSWGYDGSSSFSSKTRHSMTELSLSLLADLRAMREHSRTENTKLVFVCHSLGGILCKQMLIDSRNSPDIHNRAIYDLTVGVVFLGTPHLPSTLPSSIQAILKATGIRGQSAGIRQFTSQPDEVGRLQESFESLLQAKNQYGRPITTTSFVEAEPMGKGGSSSPVVSKSSAVLQGELPSVLPGDHSSMVKFGSPDDPGYKSLRGILVKLVKYSEASPNTLPEITSQLVELCISSLCYPGWQACAEGVSSSSPNTCDWIFDHVNYQRWDLVSLNDSSESLLWIKGNPGTGKSTLMKHMITKLRQNGRSTCLSFFFSRRGTPFQDSLVGCYRSLLCQLLQLLPECCGNVIRKVQEKTSSDSGLEKHEWSLFELSEMFHATIRDLSAEVKLYIFLDGIDECKLDESPILIRSFSESSESWIRQGKSVRLCFSSRHYPVIVEQRDHLEITLESNTEASQHDIETYLKASLPREYRSLAGRIAQRSGGMFLWASLVGKRLHEDIGHNATLKSPADIVDKLPPNLEDFYLCYLSASKTRWNPDDIALTQCILSASQSLDSSLLSKVLKLELRDFTQCEKHLISISGTLFDNSDGFLQPIHFSLRDVFLLPKALEFIGYQGSPAEFWKAGHRRLLEFCLETLTKVDSLHQVSPSTRRPIFVTENSDISLPDHSDKLETMLSQAESYAVWHTFEHLTRSASLDSDTWYTRDTLHRALSGWSLLFKQQDFGGHPEGKVLYKQVLKIVCEKPTAFDLLPQDTIYVRSHHFHVRLPRDALPMVYSQDSDLKSLREISTKEFSAINEASEVKSNLAFMKITAQWELDDFIRKNFHPRQKIEEISVIVGQPEYAQSVTCGEYVERRWQSIGKSTLNLLDKLRPKINAESKSNSQDSISTADTELDIGGMELRMMQWQGLDKLGERENAIFHCRGPMQRVLDFLEILGWLCAALRHVQADAEGLKVSDAHAELLRQEGDPTLECILWPEFLKPVAEPSTPCWRGLFERTVIVNSPHARPEGKLTALLQKLHPWFATSNRPVGAGLEIQLDRMAALACAETLVDHEGGLLYLGYSTILAPVKWLDSGALQWHLITEAKGKRITLWRVDEEIRERVLITNTKTLQGAPFHVLALWDNANILLGTEKMRNAQLKRAEVKEKKFSILLQALSFGFGLGGLGHVGPTISAAFAFPKTQIKYDPETRNLVDLLIDFQKEPVLLYDPSPAERRAWLVPKMSVVLQLVHFYVLDKNLSYKPPFAEEKANGGEAALKALENHGDDKIKSIGDSKDSGFTVTDLLRRITTNMRKMEKKHGHRIIGYDFKDLASRQDVRLRKTEYAWTTERQGWYFLTTRLPILICGGLGDIILPVDGDQPGPEFKTGMDRLAAPIRCLQAICSDGTGDLAVGKLDSDWFWDSPHTPFGDCHCPTNSGVEHARLPGCDVTQYIRNIKHSEHPPSGSTARNQDGVILVGKYTGKKLQKVPREPLQRGAGAERALIRPEADVTEADATATEADATEADATEADATEAGAIMNPTADLPPGNNGIAPGERPINLASATLSVPQESLVRANENIEAMLSAHNNGVAAEERDQEDNIDIPILVPRLLENHRENKLDWLVTARIWLKAGWNVGRRKQLGPLFLFVGLLWYFLG